MSDYEDEDSCDALLEAEFGTIAKDDVPVVDAKENIRKQLLQRIRDHQKALKKTVQPQPMNITNEILSVIERETTEAQDEEKIEIEETIQTQNIQTDKILEAETEQKESVEVSDVKEDLEKHDFDWDSDMEENMPENPCFRTSPWQMIFGNSASDDKYQKLYDKFRDLQQENGELKQNIKELNREISSSQFDRDSLEDECTSLKDKFAKLKSAHLELQDSLLASEEKNGNLNHDLDVMNAKFEHATGKSKSMKRLHEIERSRKQKLEKHNRMLKRQREKLKGDFSFLEKMTIDNMNARKNQEIRDMNTFMKMIKSVFKNSAHQNGLTDICAEMKKKKLDEMKQKYVLSEADFDDLFDDEMEETDCAQSKPSSAQKDDMWAFEEA